MTDWLAAFVSTRFLDHCASLCACCVFSATANHSEPASGADGFCLFPSSFHHRCQISHLLLTLPEVWRGSNADRSSGTGRPYPPPRTLAVTFLPCAARSAYRLCWEPISFGQIAINNSAAPKDLFCLSARPGDEFPFLRDFALSHHQLCTRKARIKHAPPTANRADAHIRRCQGIPRPARSARLPKHHRFG
ncbi:hypothetical protein BD289DRAFT_444005 [Coniella lustricola]|uniref:Secreted protein n=1 Tax=Coniella lustricola TaxID=2025994 RepID=A0A2T2ZWF8_9PEZI|nr:hypothetical protein BD289DRAFT_444005 [Coniella lustricola]